MPLQIDPKPEKPHVVRTSVVEDVLKNICWTCVQTDPPRVGFLLWKDVQLRLYKFQHLCGVEVMLDDIVWHSVCCLCLILASAFRRSRMFLMEIMAPWMPVCVRPCTITKVSSSLLLVITLTLLSDSILVICCPFWLMMCFMCVLSMVNCSESNGLGTGDDGVVVC